MKTLTIAILTVLGFALGTGRMALAAMTEGAGPGVKNGMEICCTPMEPEPAGPSAPTEAIVFGDFNGDGNQDMALGMPSYDPEGFEDAGAVRVLYGSSTGLLYPHPSVTVEFLYQYFRDNEAGDRFGASLAVGNFNNDAYDDLAVGAPGEGQDDGEVHVIFGKSTGLRLWCCEPRWSVRGYLGVGARFGFAVAAGNVIGDGADDLVVGAPGAEQGNGIVRVYQGSDSGLSDAWVQELSESNSGSYGAALAVDYFDLDGFHDLAVGAPKAVLSRTVVGCDFWNCWEYEVWLSGGAVFAYGGSQDGLALNSKIHQDDFGSAYVVGSMIDDGDEFGAALATGDFNNDSYGDLAIGAPGDNIHFYTGPNLEDGERRSNAGSVSVVFGSPEGFTYEGEQYLHQYDGRLLPEMPDEVEAGDRFGATLAAGDFDNDPHGVDDLAIGVPYEDLSETVDAGLVHVLQGSHEAGGLTDWPNDRLWLHLQLGQPMGAHDRFGYALGAGEVNGDGMAELAVSVPVDGGIGISTSGDTSETNGENSVVHVEYGTSHPNGPGWFDWQSWYEATETLE